MNFLQSINFDFIDLLKFSEKPFKAKFIPSKIWSDLDRYKNDEIGLKQYFRKWRTKVVFKTPKREGKSIPVGGEHNPDDNQSEIHIWCSNFNTFNFTDRKWDRIKYKIIQVIMHELIHCRQYMGKSQFYMPGKVKYKKTGVKNIDENREYHSNKGEIEAYAHCIYLDFKTFKVVLSVEQLLNRSFTHKDSPTLAGIIKVFNRDFKHNDAIPLLAKNIHKWDRKYTSALKLNRKIDDRVFEKRVSRKV